MRAMDAIEEYIVHLFPDDNWAIESFAVMGASKRGWTSWLVGAVDDRVEAIIPVVLDGINFHAFAHHQFQAYGGWTFALEDYLDMDIMSRLDTPEMETWATMDDPFTFFDRLTMPKLVVNAVLDEVCGVCIRNYDRIY